MYYEVMPLKVKCRGLKNICCIFSPELTDISKDVTINQIPYARDILKQI